MAISYPLQIPNQNIRRVRMIMEKVSASSMSPFTLQEQIQEWVGGERWAAEIELPPMKGRALAEQWLTFLASLRGLTGTFEMGDPLGAIPRGSPSGSPQVKVETSSQSKILVTKGWTPDAVGVLLKGDYIEYTVDSKKYLHKTLTDKDANVSGEVNLDIWPVTRKTIPADTPVITIGAKGTWRLGDSIQGWDADHLRLYGIIFKAVESVGP